MVIELAGRGGFSIAAPGRRWLTRVLLPAGLLLALLALVGYAARDALLPGRAVSVVRVVAKPIEVTETAASGDATGPVTVQAPGWIEPDPYPHYVSALTDGVVADMLVLEGQAVKAGQVVARLVDEDARLAVRRSEAALARRRAEAMTAQAQVAAATTDWENPVERDRAVAVAVAELAELEADIVQLDSTIAEQRAKAGEVKQQYDRIVKLLPDATSDLEVEQARLRLIAQEAALNAAQQQRQVLNARIAAQRAEIAAATRHRELRIAERLALETAQSRAEEAIAMVMEAEAALAEAKLGLERTQVKSPVDGVVMTRVASPGDKVMRAGDMPHSAHIVHLYDPRKLQVRVDIPLADAAKVGLGQPATVGVDVLPDRQFRGALTRIVHRASIEKNTLEVKVAILDPDPQLKPDMLARVRFHAITKSDGGTAVSTRQQLRVFAPERLIAKADGGGTVWVIDPGDQTARRRSLTLGTHRQDGWIEVTEGLRPGDVLVDEADGITDGQRVRVREDRRPEGGDHAAH